MSKQIIYLDLDDTVKDSEKYIRRYMKLNGFPSPRSGSVYKLIYTNWGEVVTDIFDNWDVIPFKPGALDGISLLSTEYEVVFCSGYHSEREYECKLNFASTMGKEIILCGRDQWDKSHVDMRGGIFVDDRTDILYLSNADRKFEMYNPYTFNLYDKRDCKTTVVDWFSLTDILMEAKVNEDLRRCFYKGVSVRG